MTTPFKFLSFNSGEISPSLMGRIDLTKYQSGLKRCKNFIVQRFGGVVNRPGLKFVGECYDSSYPITLIPFNLELNQTFILEFGHLYMRVIFKGAYLVNSSQEIITIITPYSGDDILALKYEQCENYLVLVCPNHPVKRLIYDSSASPENAWTFEDVEFKPSIDPPETISVSGGTLGSVLYWVATAVKGSEESYQTVQSSLKGGVSSTYPVNITIKRVPGAERYHVYRGYKQSDFGYIGTVEDSTYDDPPNEDYVTFRDIGYSVDWSDVPPIPRNPFDGSKGYPSCVTIYQQRLILSGLSGRPSTVYCSRTGSPFNFTTSTPMQDDDSITLSLLASKTGKVVEVFGGQKLVVLTTKGVWLVDGRDGLLTPSSINLTLFSSLGAASLKPILANESILYMQENGSIIRDLVYNFETMGFKSNELNIFCNHLFESYKFIDWDFHKVPYSCIWCIREDGILVGITYMKEHQVIGAHWHSTDGKFLRVCCVAEDREDVAYFVVEREVNGVSKKYIEYLSERNTPNAVFLDSYLSYSGEAVTTLSGLNHLEGKYVRVISEGGVLPQLFKVTNGRITLPYPTTQAHVGLPYESTIETLNIDILGNESTIDRKKHISNLYIQVQETKSLLAGTIEDRLRELKVEYDNNNNPQSATGVVNINITPNWSQFGNIIIKQIDPLPIHILSITPILT